MAQSDLISDATFYSFGQRSLNERAPREISEETRRKARQEALQGRTFEVQPASVKKYATRSGRVLSKKQSVSATVVQKPLVAAPNPHLAQANARKLEAVVAERARRMK